MTLWEGPLLGFDTETTGVDEYEDRIVSWALVLSERPGQYRDWGGIVNPGVPIPKGATEVHGITDEEAAKGMDPQTALAQIRDLISHAASERIPVVAFNASYDLTLFNAECVRHNILPLPRNFGPVLDPMVIDKGLDQYRKGKRTLLATAQHYGVPLLATDAHGALPDAKGAVDICRAIGQLPGADAATLQGMFTQQQAWRKEQQESFQQYLDRQGKSPDRPIDTGWPFLNGMAA
ncbi:DNA polymerase III subunit [Arthrobacter phage Kitkat]|uniref:DNA polymerase III subunit n=2 Tax=Kelleziovirus kitkat TaxID=1982238 RepID=A0A140G6N9_9CAUD|nr:DNA polymerase III subunit [Arthrobacter phage Kitkat]AMM44324.1 DNA polymerase III subunit [Arthrobacter phage Kitkat]QGJ96501.1 DNA polymerase III subunit [Arthrobacter phage BeatusComedenti]